MLTLDGSYGEGGGQILRSCLSLSLVTGQSFRLEKIRAGRQKPGLRAQHLVAVQAAAAIGAAETSGAELGSQTLTFAPQRVTAGDYAFAIGTAGSATLVAQTVLPALVTAAGPSAVVLEGGTHNPMAPPFEFLALTFLPLLQRMGPRVRLKLDRHGFYPAGGGKMRLTVEPVPKLTPLDLSERGHQIAIRATAVVANLPALIAERELKVLKRDLDLGPADLRVAEVKSRGPGNVVFVEVECAHLTEVFTAFGEQGVKAEVVAGRLAHEVRNYLDTDAPVGEHLADQLLLPMALAGGGSFVTGALSQHALTNLWVLQQFLPVAARSTPASDKTVRVEITGAASEGPASQPLPLEEQKG
jgi:RNA 3'-terminal phosphate cyclase (ATP)